VLVSVVSFSVGCFFSWTVSFVSFSGWKGLAQASPAVLRTLSPAVVSKLAPQPFLK
jgi:hypothetical protein